MDVAALEVEDAEDLVQEVDALAGSAQQQIEQLNLDDEHLLKDLNEPDAQTVRAQAAPDETRVSRQYRRLLYRKRSKDERSE